MADGFHRLTMRGDDMPDFEENLDVRRGALEIRMERRTNESVARHYLDLAFRTERARPVFREVLAPDRPDLVPSLYPVTEVPSPFDENTLVRFEQRLHSVRVYGSTVFVELAPDAGFVNLTAEVASAHELRAAIPGALDGVDTSLRRRSAWQRWLLRVSGARLRTPRNNVLWVTDVVNAADPALLRGSPTLDGAIEDAELVLYRDTGRERFRLCWLLPDVVAPTWPREGVDLAESDAPAGGWESSRYRRPAHDLLFDAVSGELVIALPTTRSFEVPVICTGNDEDDATRTFDARQIDNGVEMVDLPRAVSTYDFALAPYKPDPEPALGDPVPNPDPTWGDANRAAVTAHAHVVIVHDFFQNVVQWRGVDGQGAPIASVVNCADEYGRAEWPSAQWRRNRMICGQSTVRGRQISWARHLDIIAHEYTHGVTEHAVKLEYREEIGALDESLSDIFAILIVNHNAGRSDPGTWTWELGPGLAAGGGPLRDLSDPHRSTPWQPAHMSEWIATMDDHGGVHLLSGVHNRAAHLILTARLSTGELAFPLEEAARCFFYSVHGLPANACFSDARHAMVETVSRRFIADSALLAERVRAVESAYDTVGVN